MRTARHSRKVEAEGMDAAWKRVDKSSKRNKQWKQTSSEDGRGKGQRGVQRNEGQEGRGERDNDDT